MPFDVEQVRVRRPETQIHYFASTGSTMTEAARLAAGDAPHGTVVLADEQTQGVGRLGRSWESQAGVGLYCSVVLRLGLAPAALPIVALVLGLAAREAIQIGTDLACDLRWPNDVLIRGKKVAGILAQLVDGSVVAGIGINVNQERLPPNLRTPATSLKMESGGQAQSREDLLVHLLNSLDSFCSTLMSGRSGAGEILKAFSDASSYVWNRRVILEEGGGHGTTAGLDENGFLLVRYDSGTVERIATGGIRPES